MKFWIILLVLVFAPVVVTILVIHNNVSNRRFNRRIGAYLHFVDENMQGTGRFVGYPFVGYPRRTRDEALGSKTNH